MNRSWLLIGTLCCPLVAFAQTETKLTAADAASSDMFGNSVSLSGDTAVVGAYRNDDAGGESGSAYVFIRDAGGAWGQQAKLTASDGAADDYFGWAVSIDGNTAVVGAYVDDDSAGVNQGSAYVFVRDAGDSWSEQAKLLASDAEADDLFGASVSIHGDTVMVGASDDNKAGAVYAFTRDGGGTWTQEARLTAPSVTPYDWFGRSLSVNGDTAVLGAYGDDDGGSWSGAAYVFIRDAGGAWGQQAKLTASDPAAGNDFGCSVSVHADTAVIGSIGNRVVYAFTRDAGGTWTEQARMTVAENMDFGRVLSLDGNSMVVGAAGDDLAYVFRRDAGGTWTEQITLVASDAAEGDRFGQSVSLHGDTALIGAIFDDNNTGSAYVYTGAPIPVELQRYSVE